MKISCFCYALGEAERQKSFENKNRRFFYEEQKGNELEELAGGNHISFTGRTLDFNSGWKFIQKHIEETPNVNYDDSSWRDVTLPHDWLIEQDFNPSSQANAQGGYLDGGAGWYRKTFTLDESMKGKKSIH